MATPAEVRKELKKRGLPYNIYKTHMCWYVIEGDADACGAGASCDGAVTGALEPDEDSPLEVTGAGDGLGVFAAVEVFAGAGEGALVFFSAGVAGAAESEVFD